MDTNAATAPPEICVDAIPFHEDEGDNPEPAEPIRFTLDETRRFGKACHALLVPASGEQQAVVYKTQRRRDVIDSGKWWSVTELGALRQLDNYHNVVKLLYYYTTTTTSEGTVDHMLLEPMPLTLRQYCDSLHTLPRFETKLYIYQLLQALQHLLIKKISHRQLCPDHVLVNPDYGTLKICGFGDARGDFTYFAKYRPDLGMPGYRAPELLFRGSHLAYLDMWAVGCMMAELLNNGVPLFKADTAEGEISKLVAAIGTPSTKVFEYIAAEYDHDSLPKVKAKRWPAILRKKLTKGAEFVAGAMLQYMPCDRTGPGGLLDNEFFDELYEPPLGCLPSGKPMPYLVQVPRFSKRVIPRHLKNKYPREFSLERWMLKGHDFEKFDEGPFGGPSAY